MNFIESEIELLTGEVTEPTPLGSDNPSAASLLFGHSLASVFSEAFWTIRASDGGVFTASETQIRNSDLFKREKVFERQVVPVERFRVKLFGRFQVLESHKLSIP